MFAIGDSVLNRRARYGAPLGPRYSFAEPFVVGVEIEKILFGINFVVRLVSLQERFKKPGRMPDMPAWRTHKLRRLNYVILDLQRRNDLHGASAHAIVEINNRARL